MEPIESPEQWVEALSRTNSGILLVMFTASWCGPCKQLKPHLLNMARNPDVLQHGFEFRTVDIDALPELADKLEVSSVPTCFFIHRAGIVDRIPGADPEPIRQAINTHYLLTYSEADSNPTGTTSSI